MSPITDHPCTKKPSARKKTLQIGVAFGLLLIGTLGMLSFSSQAPALAVAQDPPVPQLATKLLDVSEVVKLVPLDLAEPLHFSGEVKPLRRVTLSAQVAGLAGNVTYLPGDSVTEGDLLLTIAPEDYRLTLQSAEAEYKGLNAQLDAARSTLSRTLRLSKNGVSSDATLEQAQSAATVLEASVAASGIRVEQARINLDRATIRAPISGTLAARSVEPGQLVQSGDTLFDIVDLQTVTVEALIPVTQAARLGVGQGAELWAPDAPDIRIPAEVSRIAPQAVTGTRSVSVWLTLDNTKAGLRIGSFLRGEIILARATGQLALPRTAIRADGTVMVIRAGQVQPVPVQQGAAWQGGALVTVTGGVKPGEWIVALPLTGLAAGDAVEIAGK